MAAITIESVLKELRKVGVRAKEEFGKIRAPKTVEAEQMESALRQTGWTCIKRGCYYTERYTTEQVFDSHGVFERDGMVATVVWGPTTSTNAPVVALRPKQ